jgi:hypothetical protein
MKRRFSLVDQDQSVPWIDGQPFCGSYFATALLKSRVSNSFRFEDAYWLSDPGTSRD